MLFVLLGNAVQSAWELLENKWVDKSFKLILFAGVFYIYMGVEEASKKIDAIQDSQQKSDIERTAIWDTLRSQENDLKSTMVTSMAIEKIMKSYLNGIFKASIFEQKEQPQLQEIIPQPQRRMQQQPVEEPIMKSSAPEKSLDNYREQKIQQIPQPVLKYKK